MLERFAGHAGSGGSIDPRIARVLDRLPETLDGRASTADAAGIACLSESRFSHLFVKEVGLPVRTYLLWRRLMRAVERMTAGDTLTVAAHHAGFAGSAHFSRTFHRMSGLSATALELTRSEYPFQAHRICRAPHPKESGQMDMDRRTALAALSALALGPTLATASVAPA